MGLKSLVSQIYLDKLTVAVRAPAPYIVGVHVIFTITGGPVWIVALFGHAITAVDPLAAGTDAVMDVGGVVIDAGPTAIASGAGTLILCPLDDSATDAIVPNVAAGNMPSLAGALLGAFKLMAAPGDITCTIGTAPTVGAIAWYCAYYRMSPASMVA